MKSPGMKKAKPRIRKRSHSVRRPTQGTTVYVDEQRGALEMAARSSIKGIYLQAASLAGLDVGPNSPEYLIQVVNPGFALVEPNRRPEAVANLLKLLAATIYSAQERNDTMLHEDNVMAGQGKVCPVYPFKSGR